MSQITYGVWPHKLIYDRFTINKLANFWFSIEKTGHMVKDHNILWTCNYLQRTCKYIPQGPSDCFHLVPWLSTIQIYVKSYAYLQLPFPSFAEIFCSCGQIKWLWGNQGKPPKREPAIVQIYTTSIEEFIRIVLYTSGNYFLDAP